MISIRNRMLTAGSFDQATTSRWRHLLQSPQALFMTRLVIAAVALVVVPKSAHSDREAAVRGQDPLVIDALAIEFAGIPRTIALWTGLRAWIQDRYFVGARLGLLQIFEIRDFDGDGLRDYRSGNHGPFFELGVNVGYALHHRALVRQVKAPGALTILKQEAGQAVRTFTSTVPRRQVSRWSIVSGTRLSVLGDEIQAAVPLGIRVSQSQTTRGQGHKEWYAQARALLFVPAIEPGLDLEYAWLPSFIGIGVFFQYIPALGKIGPGGLTCVGDLDDCDPDYPITGFDAVPDEAAVQFGIRIRLQHARM